MRSFQKSSRGGGEMSKRVRSIITGVLGLLVTICALPLHAQVERGTIAGTVRDASRATTPNVAVAVTNVATGVEYKTQTNDTGEFVAPNLIPGEYSVTASLSGFKTLQRKGIVLQVN